MRLKQELGERAVLSDLTEIEITCSLGKVRCTLSPAVTVRGPSVLLLHGFLSNRHEVPVRGDGRGMFTVLSNEFCNRGISSVRMDFRGCGESLGLPIGFCTPTSMVQDIIAVLRAPELQTYFRDGVVLVGWCQGAIAAMHAALLGLKACSGISLLNPFADFQSTLTKVYGRAVQEALLKSPEEFLEIVMASKKTRNVTAGFFQEMLAIEGLERLSSVSVPVQVVHATGDRILPQQDSFAEFLNKTKDEYHQISTDHAFGAFDEKNRLDDVAKIVSDFVVRLSNGAD